MAAVAAYVILCKRDKRLANDGTKKTSKWCNQAVLQMAEHFGKSPGYIYAQIKRIAGFPISLLSSMIGGKPGARAKDAAKVTFDEVNSVNDD